MKVTHTTGLFVCFVLELRKENDALKSGGANAAGVSALEDRIIALEAQVAEKDAEIARLMQALQERDLKIAELRRALKDEQEFSTSLAHQAHRITYSLKEMTVSIILRFSPL